MDNQESVRIAERCRESGLKHKLDIHFWSATTPKDRPKDLFEASDWPTDKFYNKWNHPEAAMAAFLSHVSLWRACATENDKCFLIMEHDAVVVERVPNLYYEEKLVCNVAKPSYGKFKTPSKEGFQTFSSGLGKRRYFKGLTGYIVSPSGARGLLQKVKEAEPADIFINKERFPWLTEMFPWSVECHDSISTIQKETGCRAKHRPVTPLKW